METLQVPADLPPITALRSLSKPDQMGFILPASERGVCYLHFRRFPMCPLLISSSLAVSGTVQVSPYQLDQVLYRTNPCRINWRPYICAPNRVLWCRGDQHALLFCPTHLYDPLWAEWWLRAPDAAPVGEPRALFVLSGKNIIYVGTYTLLSLRHIRPPGALPPREIVGRSCPPPWPIPFM
jgi:hypothetical protein